MHIHAHWGRPTAMLKRRLLAHDDTVNRDLDAH
jgi:hypothetical protein